MSPYCSTTLMLKGLCYYFPLCVCCWLWFAFYNEIKRLLFVSFAVSFALLHLLHFAALFFSKATTNKNLLLQQQLHQVGYFLIVSLLLLRRQKTLSLLRCLCFFYFNTAASLCLLFIYSQRVLYKFNMLPIMQQIQKLSPLRTPKVRVFCLLCLLQGLGFRV